MNRLVFTLLMLAAASSANAATIVIQNDDGPGEGFNDPTSVSPVGGNDGTTLGQQRLNVFQAAADRWGEVLQSDVTIVVSAQFNTLACSETSGTLGSAGTASSSANFTGGEPGVRYHAALADALAGSNITGTPDINATFNSAVDDEPNCLGGNGFYYGLQQKPDGTPGSALFPVVLHELGHGLGFQDFVNDGTGAFSGGLPDAFSRLLYDIDNDQFWDEMTDGERFDSARDDPNLVWGGATVDGEVANVLDPEPEVVINAPGPISGTYEAVAGDEPDSKVPLGGLTADIIDGNVYGDGCDFFSGNPPFANKIVLINLPEGCGTQADQAPGLFAALFVDDAGAAGVLIAPTSGIDLPDVSGRFQDPTVDIPYLGIRKSVADSLRADIGSANVSMRPSATAYSGTNGGMLRMHAPANFSSGSSVAHWTPGASPNLLMEPSLSSDLPFDGMDLTISAFEDMGWPVVGGGGGGDDLIFKSGFEASEAP